MFLNTKAYMKFFKSTHKDVDMSCCTYCAHCITTGLKVVGAIKYQVVQV